MAGSFSRRKVAAKQEQATERNDGDDDDDDDDDLLYPVGPMLSISVRYEIKCMCVFQCSLDQKQFLCSVSDKTTPTI